MKSIPRDLVRKLLRSRRRSDDEYVVGIDQSLSNCACVLFKNGIPVEREVFHTGSVDTKEYQTRVRRGDIIFGEYFESHTAQVEYIVTQVVELMSKWNPQYIALEGLAYNATGKTERQLAGLYHSIITSLHRELDYCLHKQILTITPNQAKKLARSKLPTDEQYLKTYTTSGKPKLNPMKKPDMIKALQCTEHAWLLDGYTRKTLVASRKMPTGIEDLPDAYFIGKFFINNKSLFL